MEELIDDMTRAVYALHLQVEAAKTLVDEGKEVLCSRQLQGASTKCAKLLSLLKDLTSVVKKNSG